MTPTQVFSCEYCVTFQNTCFVKTRGSLSLEEPKLLIRLFIHTLIKQWCTLSEEIRTIVSVNKFKETIISFLRPKENCVFAIHDTKGLKLLTRLRLNFSHLNEHKFRHGFKDTVDPVCKCGVETETTLHFLLRCRLYSNIENRTPGRYIYILLIHLLRIILKINF